ncbi:hypothetical protein [Sunxiuqinia elliptica]|uniref:Uncharacterized protein n=1 Tax=Sunxiuqinia elliptica TaxID=655355 RepID=A0A1I2LQT9_9BACT|nr:hypothetical protein [Sunxiuqinia elliptica]SFF81872.1 hypothetical protein SAMN05216283_1176 [Sunxiuqinia elliptica]
MIFEARQSLKSQLLEMPETGMGYQIIDAIQEGKYSSQRFVVYNTELVVNLDSDFDLYKRKIINEGYSSIKASSPYLELKDFQFVSRSKILEFRVLVESKMTEKGRFTGGSGATDNKEEYANGEEIFVRLSAYEDDKRIDFDNKKLKSGSYTTTYVDYQTCKRYNDDPVDRYALPNNEEIKWAFYIQPKSYDKLQRGIVQPAFGHDGGGIEAYFKNGTSNNTFFRKTAY